MHNNAVESDPDYTAKEELINALSHGVGLVLAIIGAVFLLLRSETSVATASCAVYAASLITMFLASTLYHSCTVAHIRRQLKLIDHSAIYLLIAGTYTPFLAISLGGWLGWVSISVIWSIALFGVIFKVFVGHRFPRISVITYLVMGWLAILLAYPLYNAVPSFGLLLLVAGGLSFSIGVAFYVKKHITFTHAVWHFFVIAGCACHFFAIYYFVI